MITCKCVITCGHELKMRTFNIVVVPTPSPQTRKVRLNHPWMWFYKEMGGQRRQRDKKGSRDNDWRSKVSCILERRVSVLVSGNM